MTGPLCSGPTVVVDPVDVGVEEPFPRHVCAHHQATCEFALYPDARVHTVRRRKVRVVQVSALLRAIDVSKRKILVPGIDRSQQLCLDGWQQGDHLCAGHRCRLIEPERTAVMDDVRAAALETARAQRGEQPALEEQVHRMRGAGWIEVSSRPATDDGPGIIGRRPHEAEGRRHTSRLRRRRPQPCLAKNRRQERRFREVVVEGVRLVRPSHTEIQRESRSSAPRVGEIDTIEIGDALFAEVTPDYGAAPDSHRELAERKLPDVLVCGEGTRHREVRCNAVSGEKRVISPRRGYVGTAELVLCSQSKPKRRPWLPCCHARLSVN